MNSRIFRFHLSTLIIAVFTIGCLMTVQFYRMRALDAPLVGFGVPLSVAVVAEYIARRKPLPTKNPLDRVNGEGV